MEKRAIDRNQAIPAHDQSPEITEPGEGALDFPPPAISPQLSAILQLGLGAIAAMKPPLPVLIDLVGVGRLIALN